MYDLVTSPTRQPPSSTVESRLQKSIPRRGREKCASRAINVVKTNKEREKDRKRERERELGRSLGTERSDCSKLVNRPRRRRRDLLCDRANTPIERRKREQLCGFLGETIRNGGESLLLLQPLSQPRFVITTTEQGAKWRKGGGAVRSLITAGKRCRGAVRRGGGWRGVFSRRIPPRRAPTLRTTPEMEPQT